jgi:hypothetical protein
MAFVRPQPFGRAQGLGSSYNLWVNTIHHSLSDSAKPRAVNNAALWASLQQAAHELGFSQIGVTGVNLSDAEPGLLAWLEAGFHGSMNYMASHGLKRARPAELVPGTVSVITARLNYLPRNQATLSPELEMLALQRPQQGVVSVYARGRDYHKVLRSRLQLLHHSTLHRRQLLKCHRHTLLEPVFSRPGIINHILCGHSLCEHKQKSQSSSQEQASGKNARARSITKTSKRT